MRIFIGVSFDKDTTQYIEEVQNKISNFDFKAKLVEPENFHLCLSFIGNVDESDVDNISEKLNKICKTHPGFKIDLTGVLIIPNESYIKVLAIGVSEKSGILNDITKAILKEIGGNVKPPHITLCRVKGVGDKKRLVRDIKNLNVNLKDVGIDSIKIVESVLSKSGPKYNIIKKIELSR